MIYIEGLEHLILKIDKLKIDKNCAILGPNGSGKSILLRIIVHEIWPRKIKKREVFSKNLTLKEARKIFGIVNSELEYFYKNEDISVFDAIISAFRKSLVVYNFFEFSNKEIERAHFLCSRFSLPEKKCVRDLSLGELKKVLIARALVHEPKIICLDEPTNGLDIKAKIDFFELLESLPQQKILITHDFSEIGKQFNQVVMIKNGKIFLNGDRSILNIENISKLFDVKEEKLKEFYG